MTPVNVTFWDSTMCSEWLAPCLPPSDYILKMRDGIRRPINVYTDNFIKSELVDIPVDGNKNVCILLEPYCTPPWTDVYDYIQTDFEKFDLVITHNKDKLGHLLEERPDKFYYSSKCAYTTWLDEANIKLHPKSKMISCPFSWKHYCLGHRLRHAVYNSLNDTGLVDFYGSGAMWNKNQTITGREHHPHEDPCGGVLTLGSEESQRDTLCEFRTAYYDYKYVIIIENAYEQTGFNSEKLYDCFLSGCVPIYCGSKIFDDNINMDGIVEFNMRGVELPDPDCPVEEFHQRVLCNKLKDIVDFLNKEDPYEKMLPAIEHNFNYAKTFMRGEDSWYRIFKDLKFL